MLEERILDLAMREADVAIRLKEPSQAELIRRRILDVHIRLYASRVREKHGLPTTVEELSAHRLITQSPASPQVRAGAEFVQPLLAAAQSSSLTVNNYFGILQGVIHGLGIGSLPDYLTGDFPDLVHVLPGEQSAPIPTYLAYVEELRHSKRVRRFATSSSRRSRFQARGRSRRPSQRPEPCRDADSGHAQHLGIGPCRRPHRAILQLEVGHASALSSFNLPVGLGPS